jgi:hypothetical protein
LPANLVYFLASYASLLLLCQACQPDSSGISAKVKFPVSLLSGVVGWVVGWLGGWLGGWVGGWVGGVKLKLKLNSAQLKLEFGLSFAKIQINQISATFDISSDHQKFLVQILERILR